VDEEAPALHDGRSQVIGLAFRVKIAAKVRSRLAMMPEHWAERLAHRLQELAELAEIHPVSHAREAPVTLQMVVDRLRVHYEVDRDRRQLTVTGLTELRRDEDPGPFGAS
jgi:hypothetical protein